MRTRIRPWWMDSQRFNSILDAGIGVFFLLVVDDNRRQ